MHLPVLISDLGFILVTAAMVSLLFKKLKQPVVLGYLLAGFLVGPNWPTVTDVASITVWAEIGVIFLLFGLGLEFNLKKLTLVGKKSTIIASFEVLFMLTLGFVTGRFLGWKNTDSLFLGAMLSISSTTIIVRSFEELGIKAKNYVNVVFGVLVIEDLFAILLMALLTTFALSDGFSGQELLTTLGKLSFFLLLWFSLGIYLLPTFFKKIESLLSEESLLITSVGLCLLMVIIVTKVDFSPALGAFLIGALLAETKSGGKIEKILHPIKDLFGAIFFVSIGMLINPSQIWEFGYPILIITVITVIGKILSTSIGAILSGVDAKNSLKTGFSLAQIGEFSFIMATLGSSLKVTSEFLYPIAVSVSAITTFLTPYLIKNSEKTFLFLEKNLPPIFWKQIHSYQSALNQERTDTGLIHILWKAYGWRSLISSVFIVAIFQLSKHIKSFLITRFDNNWSIYITIALVLIATLLSSPFFSALTQGKTSPTLNKEEASRLYNLKLGIQIVRYSAAFILAIYCFKQIIPVYTLPLFILFLILSSVIFLTFFSNSFFKKMENKFVANLNWGESQPHTTIKLSPWENKLYDFIVNPNSELVGKTLQDVAFRSRFNSIVVLIERGSKLFFAPKKDWMLMPFDKLKILSTDEQFEKIFRDYEHDLNTSSKSEPAIVTSEANTDFGLQFLKLEKESPLVGKRIKDTKLRESIEGVIVGIERENERKLIPDPETLLQINDYIWIVGNLKKISSLRNQLKH
ncbi:MAG: cation:proton antiporter [Bdellovibrionaceae bacterium]|nr:cation:proton antiporter [Pseudobdellovibrionaceae bacterium]